LIERNNEAFFYEDHFKYFSNECINIAKNDTLDKKIYIINSIL